MSGKVTSPTAGVSRTVNRRRSAEAVDAVHPSVAPSQPQAAAGADLRLIIEEVPDSSELVYTLVDRRTGKVVSRMTRDEMLRLREQSNYAAGDVFDAKA